MFLSAHWRHLCLVNYEIHPDLLTPYLPFGTELDYFEGKTYVSLVAFMFYDTRLFGKIPALFHDTFEEINLRFYVVRNAEGRQKRGVVFVKEIVPKPILAWVARTFYRENYVAMPTSNTIEAGTRYQYQWAANRLTVASKGELLQAAEGSKERWITEHYWGYTRLSPQKTYEYEVRHPVWNLYRVQSHKLNADVGSLYGKEFESLFSSEPQSVFLADGSDVTVHFPTLIK